MFGHLGGWFHVHNSDVVVVALTVLALSIHAWANYRRAK